MQRLEDKESKMGVLGFTSTKQNIELISEQKEKVDQEKANTLEGISKIVGVLEK